MDVAAAVVVIAALALVLVWASRRWGPPRARLYVRAAVALWIIAGTLAAEVLWLALR